MLLPYQFDQYLIELILRVQQFTPRRKPLPIDPYPVKPFPVCFCGIAKQIDKGFSGEQYPVEKLDFASGLIPLSGEDDLFGVSFFSHARILSHMLHFFSKIIAIPVANSMIAIAGQTLTPREPIN